MLNANREYLAQSSRSAQVTGDAISTPHINYFRSYLLSIELHW